MYIVAAAFEVMQNHCKAHLSFSPVPTKGKALSVVRKPVLNPSHRGVIDDAEKASLLVTVDQLYAALK